MVKIAGSIRNACHRRMLQLDEALCRHVLAPPDYDLPSNEIADRARQFSDHLCIGPGGPDI